VSSSISPSSEARNTLISLNPQLLSQASKTFSSTELALIRIPIILNRKAILNQALRFLTSFIYLWVRFFFRSIHYKKENLRSIHFTKSRVFR